MSPGLVRRLLRLYPKRWRERYGEEFGALLETQPPSVGAVADVVTAAMVARVRALIEAVQPGGGAWNALGQELRYAARGIKRQPGFTTAVVATLAIGIGANAAMFDIVDRMLFRPPPFLRESDRVHRAYLARVVGGTEFPGRNIQYKRYVELTRWATSFDRTAAVFHPQLVVGIGDDAREMRVAAVSASLFPLFDAPPALGRYFTEQEDATPAGTPVVVLSHSYWQTRYGGSPSVLGQKVHIGPVVFTVIGVAPQRFTGVTSYPTIAFIPITAYGANLMGDRNSSEYYTEYSSSWMEMIVRRKPGVSVESATADLTAAFRRSYLAQRTMTPGIAPIDVARPRAIVAPLLLERGPRRSSDAKIAIWIGGVAAIVLLIAAANVTNLLLTRTLGRRREIALRQALGVSRGRLIQQMLSESVLIALLAGVVGLVLAQVSGSALRVLLQPATAGGTITLDARTILFVLAAVLLAGTAIAMAPLAYALRGDFADGLRSGPRHGVLARSRLRGGLLLVQVALSLVLLVGSGLFVRSLIKAGSVHLGYDVDPILYVEAHLRNESPTRDGLAALKQRLLERAKSLPGVVGAARVSTVPFYNSSSGPIVVPGLDTAMVNRHGEFTRQLASPEYFATAGTRIMRGRAFTAADRQGTPRVAVVTDAMARALWPGVDAVGRCFKMGSDSTPCTTVIGVTENVRLDSLESAGSLHYYLPIDQRSPAGGGLFVRVQGDARKQVELVRRELQRVMPGTSYVTVIAHADIMGIVVRSWRLGATMFTVFGALALLVASIGLYSVISYNVKQRTHELGIRIALGARAGDVLRLVVGGGLRFALAGVAVGIAIALAVAKWVTPLLFNVSARDPLIYGAVALVLFLVAAVASYLPARRATRVDPNTVLRAE
jgi:putative ABC transport system permease protein